MLPDSHETPGILVVDDNPADVRLVREALSHRRVHAAEDAASALGFLAGATPGLILLDLSLPRMNGHELLARIRAEAKLSSTPVVIFSSSDSPEDIERAYAGLANGYVTKPSSLDGFLDTVRRIDRFWLSAR